MLLKLLIYITLGTVFHLSSLIFNLSCGPKINYYRNIYNQIV